jgi:hypothetical protein
MITQDENEFKRMIDIQGATDGGGVRIIFYLKGKLGVVQYKLSPGWYLPGLFKTGNTLYITGFENNEKLAAINQEFFMNNDLGYHSYKPMYEGQISMGKCELMENKDCYYEGSSLQADYAFEALVKGGDDGVWKLLQKFYKNTFS